MSNARKATTPRKASRAAAAKEAAALDEGLSITIDGETHTVVIGDVTSSIARELRAATGRGVYGLIEEVSKAPDVDLIADFVWLARRIGGEDVALSDVEFTYNDLLSDGFEVAVAGDQDGDDLPEA